MFLSRRWCCDRLVVEQNALRRAVEIVELAGSHAPQKGEKAQSPQAKRDRDEEQQDGQDIFSLRTRPARNALRTTMIDELDMATAAISGVTKPMIASGTAAKL